MIPRNLAALLVPAAALVFVASCSCEPTPPNGVDSGGCTPCSRLKCGQGDGCGGTCLPGSGCSCTKNCTGVACGSSDGCGGTCAPGSGCVCTPSCIGKICGDSNGCGGTCTPGSGCTGSSDGGCTPACAGLLCGSSDGCGGTCTADGGCVPPDAGCVPSCGGRFCGPDGCGGACGTCAAFQVCSGAGQCAYPPCSPACTAPATCCDGQTCCGSGTVCDTSTATCVDPCTPPCPVGWSCDTSNPANYTCKANRVTCTGTPCAAGQICQGGACTCTPSSVSTSGTTVTLFDDSCFNYGMTCNTSTRQCDLPTEEDYCNPLTGCQAGLDCTDEITASTPTGGTVVVYRCLRPCTSFADCRIPYTTCYTAAPSNGVLDPTVVGHCAWNICGTPFSTCQASSANSGTCLPINPTLWEERTTSSGCVAGQACYVNFPYVLDGFSSCFEGGTSLRPDGGGPYANCNPSAQINVDAGGSLCPTGAMCTPITTSEGYCEPLCNVCTAAQQGSPLVGCPAGQACDELNVNNLFQLGCAPPPAGATNCSGGICAVPGVCDNSCPLFGSGSCPGNASGRPFSCEALPTFAGVSSATGSCVGELPDAGGLGSSGCLLDQDCRDRLYCTGDPNLTSTPGPGKCEPYCQLPGCKNPDAGCCPTGTLCQDLTGGAAGVVVGFCQ